MISRRLLLAVVAVVAVLVAVVALAAQPEPAVACCPCEREAAYAADMLAAKNRPGAPMALYMASQFADQALIHCARAAYPAAAKDQP